MRSRLPVLILLVVLLAGLVPTLSSVARSALAQQTTPLPTNTLRPTALPTNTPRFTPTPLAPTATNTLVPLPPTETPTATATEPVYLPTPTLYYPPELTPRAVPETPIPTAVPRMRGYDESGNPYEIFNILLVGHDGDVVPSDPNFHTDTLIVVSINRDTNTVSMLSLPRDLYVYIPNWGMNRLNTAWMYGESIGWTDGGWGMMRQTILYNFGIEVHYYAMVDFDAFEEIINTIGGVDIAVDCALTDLRYQGPGDDGVPGLEDYLDYTLNVGVYHMDGELALWYSRSRHTTMEFDRGRRQQQVLRAIWAQTKANGMITQIPDLWEQITSVVDTNLPLSEVIGLMPLALSIEPNDIENHFFRKGIETMAWQPSDGSNVQIPDPSGGMIRLIENFLAPPTQNRLRLEDANIEIYNGSPNEGWDIVAAERLVWEGFAPAYMGAADNTNYTDTMIYDYTGSSKGSSLGELMHLLNINPANVLSQPDPNRTSDFRIILGSNYNSCVDRQVVDTATAAE